MINPEGTAKKHHRNGVSLPGGEATEENLRMERIKEPTLIFIAMRYTGSSVRWGRDGMRIYLDLVMLLNFTVDWLLILGANRLAGFSPGGWNSVAGAAIGGVYSGVCLLPGFAFLGRPLWRMASLCCICTVGFGLQRGNWRRWGIFLLLSMALGGIAVGVGRTGFFGLLLSGLGLFILCAVAFGGGIGGRQYVSLGIPGIGGEVHVTALRDTGNCLRDPITGENVTVIDGRYAKILVGLSLEQIGDPMKTLAEGTHTGLRLIPYRTVGNGGRFLLARRFSDVDVGGKKQALLLAFSPEEFGRKEAYQALIGG